MANQTEEKREIKRELEEARQDLNERAAALSDAQSDYDESLRELEELEEKLGLPFRG